MKKQSGITLIVLLITIVVMTIVTATIITTSSNAIKVKKLNNMYSDIKILDDRVFTHFNKYGALPVIGAYTGTNTNFLQVKNPNDDNLYYVIDITYFNNLALTRNLTWVGDDVYIINNASHTIYYPKGVTYEDNIYYTVDKYIGKDDEVDFVADKTQYISTRTVADPLSAHVHVGDYITYDPTLGVTNQSLLSYTSPVGTLKVKNSNNEYAINETGTNTYSYNGTYNLLNANGEFTIPSGYTVDENGDMHGNGFMAQTFTAIETSTVWRVLDVNQTTRVVKIVPGTPIDNFSLKGLRGYKNAVTELDNISSIFGYGQGANGAESIKVEQINELTGHTTTSPAEAKTVGELGVWNDMYYGYDADNNLSANIKSMIFKNPYWLASTCVSAGSRGVTFCVRNVYNSNGGGVTRSRLWYANSNGNMDKDSYSNGVFPVVSLKPSVQYLSGAGTQASPWVFQATN